MSNKIEALQKDILNDMDSMNDCCRPLVAKVVDMANLQAEEMDRFWKAIGLHDKNISIDDAIEIVLKWKEKEDKTILYGFNSSTGKRDIQTDNRIEIMNLSEHSLNDEIVNLKK